MTLLTKSITAILLLLSVISFGQTNIFDCDNSKRFAEYLFNTGQYQLSQHELERLTFFCDMDSSSSLLLLKSYRKMKEFSKAKQFFPSNEISTLNTLSPEYRDEYVRLLMSQRQYADVRNKIDNGLNISQKTEHQIGSELLLKNWEKAYQLSLSEAPKMNFKIAGLRSVAQKSHAAKRKSPVLASIMSAIIPGTGKMYCGYWGDGVISLLFTASSTYFAVRGFQKYGTTNVYPWIIGGLAFSYYASNVYGGAASAIRYNDNLDHGFIHETEQILYSDY
jgi:TM2 domain-containing membrane protein YozV